MGNKDKIIFLDIDGVLNSDKFYENRLSRDDKYSNIDINTINLLNSLEIDNLKIVISSSYGEDGIELLKPLLKIPIVGCTKHYSINYDWICRGNDILEWLNSNDYYATVFPTLTDNVRYCIIDDNEDILLCQKDKFVKVDKTVGLTKKDINKIIKILNYDH
ncbi:MAG: hypothetical protein [Wendovervirus sonii]|uniref:Phosphatase n=1 Tax=phage Lak_Megaphage_Sonny TaxID=3109229 RepID=A0ABZ0Z3N9_9CAUD|nr:MAG: hypothetical protein [phage Lak_Megaphage_Sonny]